MKNIKHVLLFLKEHKFRYIVGIFILIAIDGLQLVTPWLIGNLTDDVMNSALDPAGIWRYIFFILLTAGGVAIGRFSWRVLIIGSSKKLEAWLRAKLFGHLELLSANFFNTHKTGDLMALATNDLNSVRMAFGMGIILIVDAVFLTLMTLTTMITSIDLGLTLMAFLPMPIIAVSVMFLGFRMRNRFQKVQEAFGTLTDKVQETFSGIRIVKSFVQEESELAKFEEANDDNLKKNMSLIRIWGLMFPLVGLVASVSLLVTLSVGGNMVIDGTLSLGQFVTFITYIGLLTWPMMAIGWVVNVMQRGFVSLGRIAEVLDTEPEIVDADDVDKTPPSQWSITFDDVTFTYPGAEVPALDKLNFTLQEGQTLAIVGRTGSGKTTLLNLLLRMYDTTSGEIRIGDRPLQSITLKDLRNNIGVVPQDNYLFSQPIADNIRFGVDEASMDTVKNYAEVASIRKEIEDFAGGFETLLGERGVNMSGGQKQRVSIARALIKDPSILVLDDSLSAVDTKTEEKILDHLKEQMVGRTAIIVAHRISTVRDADHILVLDEGKIIQSGTHGMLVDQDGLYKELHDKQQLEEFIMEEAR